MTAVAEKPGLTLKQKIVCDLVVTGLSSKEISRRLGISKRTVDSHRVEVYRKKGVKNAVELVRLLMTEEGIKAHG
jgi:DNA-binding CsgD family transcriptional regulator